MKLPHIVVLAAVVVVVFLAWRHREKIVGALAK
jgi:hypothetical protein